MTAGRAPRRPGPRDGGDAGLWPSFGAALRLIVGWFSAAIGALNLSVEVDRQGAPGHPPFLLFHAVYLVGGLVLVGLPWLRPRPGTGGYAAGAAVAALGALGSALPTGGAGCCLAGYDARHGFPFDLVGRTAAGRWHVDAQHLLNDLLFWSYVGLLALVVVGLVRPAATPRHGTAGRRTAARRRATPAARRSSGRPATPARHATPARPAAPARHATPARPGGAPGDEAGLAVAARHGDRPGLP